MNEAKISLQDIGKSFGKVRVLGGINLSLQEGCFLSVVGPSGSGKTTLLRIIAGFLFPDMGRVFIDGRDVTEEPPRNRGIGMVFQHYALFPNLDVYENVAFGLRARKTSEEEVTRRVREMLELVHLSEKARSFPQELSGGQRQRVALARALAPRPKVLLLDEPLSALDAKVRLELRYELKRIQEEMKITTVYVTHDQEEALSISDLVAVLHEGRIAQLGKPEEIYSRPATRFVAEFVGISTLVEMEVISAKEGMLRFQGIVIRGQPLPEGCTKVLVMLRPEHLSVWREGERREVNTTWNTLPGIVLGQVFLGSLVRLAVLVKDTKFLVDLQNREENRFHSGERVFLAFPLEAIHYLYEEKERRFSS